MTSDRRTLGVRALARVEGEGRLDVTIRDGRAERVALNIYEPPRFFEGFLRGRHFLEPPDITSRICGICPVAYQVSACNALESACGIELDPGLQDLRRLLYCGEWIASHVLHIYFLHAPDFLRAPDAIAVARTHRDAVERGLTLKKAGNAILDVVGGRAIHPVNMRVGGFYRVPTRAELTPLAEALRGALDSAVATADWVAGFDFPDVERDGPCWPCTTTRTTRSKPATFARTTGLRCRPAEFPTHVMEHQVPHSTALHATPRRPAVPHRTAGPIRAQRRAAHRIGRRGRARPPGSPHAVETPSAASSFVRSR